MQHTHRNFLILALVLLLALPASQLLAQEEGASESEEDRILYALGLALGQNLTTFNLSADQLTKVKEGLTDVALGKEPKVDLATYGPKLQAFAQGRMQAAAEAEKAEGEQFLTAEAAKEGAVRTDSGLIYQEQTAGSGASPAATDKIKVHYHGTFRDGKVFDSSVERGTPAEFGLDQVIPCWTEGIQKMKVGGKARLVCPSDIAYGDQGRPGIPGGAVLIFDVELLEIVTPSATE